MPTRNNSFQNIPDPILSPEYMEAQIDRMAEIRDRLIKQRQQVQAEPRQEEHSTTVWDDIREELSGLNDTQKAMLFADEDYKRNDEAIAVIAAQYQLQALMPYVMNDPEGQKLLERQLHLIKAKKDSIIKAEQEEMQAFRVWKAEQLAAKTKK